MSKSIRETSVKLASVIALTTLATMTSCDIHRLDLKLALEVEAGANPKPAGLGMTQTKAELTDSCVLFWIECDESVVPFTKIDERSDEVRRQFLAHLHDDDIEHRSPLHEIAGCAKRCNLPIVWVYEATESHRQTIIRIEPREMK
ncbi:MAG: hypothetical protein II951_01245 [Bacteroidales bacterium]|jgi:hypothetical protein|nr:hypothetical protein [Bacteroidales bacterium]